MATDSQINANRENAQHSTGPKTPEGKQRSSLNATKFGLTGRTVVLPSEDLEVYAKFLQEWTDELKPVGIKEARIRPHHRGLQVALEPHPQFRGWRVRARPQPLRRQDRHRSNRRRTSSSPPPSRPSRRPKHSTASAVTKPASAANSPRPCRPSKPPRPRAKPPNRPPAKRPSPSSSTTKCWTNPSIPRNLGSNCRTLEIERAARRADLLGHVKIAQASGYNRQAVSENDRGSRCSVRLTAES